MAGRGGDGEGGAAGLSYRAAGVDIDAGERLVDAIRPAAAATDRPGVMGGLGGFGAAFDLAAAGFRDPVLVAATDGVGTKLRIAIETGRLGGIGQDLVAMCVNDLVCQGAEPLFFLDYFATGRLDPAQAATVVEGVAEGCAIANCALVGGETAEMPGFYAAGDFDVAGFAVGAAERGALLPKAARPGDVLIGLAASGVHSNGFSLIRRVAERAGLGWSDPCPFGPGDLGAALLAPTRIYVAAALALARRGGACGFAHVTGGGLTENTPRMLPEGLGAEIDLSAWTPPPVFQWLAEAGGVAPAEMRRTFNLGIGLVVCLPQTRAEDAIAIAEEAGERAVRIGRVVEGAGVRYAP